MLILIWTLASICFALMCGLASLMGKNTALELENDVLVKTKRELESELFDLKRPRIEFDEENDLFYLKPFSPQEWIEAPPDKDGSTIGGAVRGMQIITKSFEGKVSRDV